MFSIADIQEAIGAEIADRVRERVPQRSGRLRDSIRWENGDIESTIYGDPHVERVIDDALEAVDTSVIDEIVYGDLDKIFGVRR